MTDDQGRMVGPLGLRSFVSIRVHLWFTRLGVRGSSGRDVAAASRRRSAARCRSHVNGSGRYFPPLRGNLFGTDGRGRAGFSPPFQLAVLRHGGLKPGYVRATEAQIICVYSCSSVVNPSGFGPCGQVRGPRANPRQHRISGASGEGRISYTTGIGVDPLRVRVQDVPRQSSGRPHANPRQTWRRAQADSSTCAGRPQADEARSAESGRQRTDDGERFRRPRKTPDRRVVPTA
jgi:hypothetical protein